MSQHIFMHLLGMSYDYSLDIFYMFRSHLLRKLNYFGGLNTYIVEGVLYVV